MSADEELARQPAWELRRKMGSGELSPSELTLACLEQVERCNPEINAICTLSESWLEDARRLDGTPPEGAGPLFGLPVGIKDVTETAGLRTTYGSPLYAGHVPRRDALVVERLRAAGAIIAGKTNTPEFAAGGNTFNDVFGVTRNPWDRRLSAGGSTGGGAAALASGMIALAQGTDLGGSLRIPASFCGVVGLRPSPGRVPTYPSEYLWDNLQVSGPMARTARDVALMLDAIAGPDERSPIALPDAEQSFLEAVEGGIDRTLRLAYCPDVAGIGVDAEVERLCRRAALEMSETGATVEEVELDLGFARNAFLWLRGHWMVAHQYRRLRQVDRLGPNVAGNVRAGLEITTRQLAEAEQARNRIWEMFREFFERFDHLLTPCMAVPPFPATQNYPETVAGQRMETYVDWIAPTFLLSLTGLPVASVPCGLDSRSLPVGLQIVGRPFGEGAVLALAHQIQEAFPIGLPPLEWSRREASESA